MRMALKVLSSDGLLRSLIDGEIDVAVSPLTSQLPEAIRSRTLFDELTSIVCRKWHPILACDGAAMPKEIAACAWILPSTQVSARQRIDAYFRKHKLHGPNAMVENTYGSPVGVFTLIVSSDLAASAARSITRLPNSLAWKWCACPTCAGRAKSFAWCAKRVRYLKISLDINW